MLILAILALGMLIGWLAQLALGMGTKPNAQSLIAGLVGSFVGGLIVSLLAGDGLKLRPSGLIGSFLGAVIVLLDLEPRRRPAPVAVGRRAPRECRRPASVGYLRITSDCGS